MLTFVFGLIFGAAGFWAFLEWREYKNQNDVDDDNDDGL